MKGFLTVMFPHGHTHAGHQQVDLKDTELAQNFFNKAQAQGMIAIETTETERKVIFDFDPKAQEITFVPPQVGG